MSPQPSPERFIERGPLKRLMLFSGSSNRPLADDIAAELGVELGEVSLKTFANDETYCRYGESIRGADVFIVQSGSPPGERPPDGAPDHDPGREARLGEAHHRRHPVVSVHAPGQEVRSRESRSRPSSSPTCSRSRASTAC